MAQRIANPQGKARKVGKEPPYETWRSFDGTWTWEVFKRYQHPDKDKAPFARAFCRVVTPYTGPSGDLGDVYIAEIKRNAILVAVDGKPLPPRAGRIDLE